MNTVLYTVISTEYLKLFGFHIGMFDITVWNTLKIRDNNDIHVNIFLQSKKIICFLITIIAIIFMFIVLLFKPDLKFNVINQLIILYFFFNESIVLLLFA